MASFAITDVRTSTSVVVATLFSCCSPEQLCALTQCLDTSASVEGAAKIDLI